MWGEIIHPPPPTWRNRIRARREVLYSAAKLAAIIRQLYTDNNSISWRKGFINLEAGSEGTTVVTDGVCFDRWNKWLVWVGGGCFNDPYTCSIHQFYNCFRYNYCHKSFNNDYVEIGCFLIFYRAWLLMRPY